MGGLRQGERPLYNLKCVNMACEVSCLDSGVAIEDRFVKNTGAYRTSSIDSHLLSFQSTC